MSRKHFVFGWVVGVTVALIGVAFSALGPAGWHLALVGIGICGVTLASWFQSNRPSVSAGIRVKVLSETPSNSPA